MEYERFYELMKGNTIGDIFDSSEYEGGFRALYGRLNRDDLSDPEVKRFALTYRAAEIAAISTANRLIGELKELHEVFNLDNIS